MGQHGHLVEHGGELALADHQKPHGCLGHHRRRTRSPVQQRAEIAEGDPAVIFYTSGTTGKPKGAISSHRSMIAILQNTMYNAVAGALGSGAPGGPDTRRQAASLLSSPMFHVSGCHSGVVVGLAAGAKTVMLEGALLRREQIGHLSFLLAPAGRRQRGCW